jgi:DNA-binding NarL/FixJ family response regulator
MRILVVDDHMAMRQCLVRTFEEEAEMQVVAEAADGYAAIELTKRLKPDVVVMDIEMPRLDGISATRQIASESPETRIIGLSTHRSSTYVRAMLAAGASAYVLKDDMLTDLVEAVEAVSDGQPYLSPALSSPVGSHNPFAPEPGSCCNGREAVPTGRTSGA